MAKMLLGGPDHNEDDHDPASDGEEPDVDMDEARYALIQSLTTGEGAQQFVQSISLELLLQEECDWGSLLSAAPRALCSMGQCFVIASTPMSSSIQLAPNTLQYKSLRANLVHCSDLGRKAFREAEDKMSRVSGVTQFICESNGTIDKILRALNDDALTRHELPRQLERLKKFSERCVEDAKSVKDQFSIWQQKAEEIRRACVESDHENTTKTKALTDRVEVVSMQEQSLAEEAEASKIETSEARDDVNFHRKEFEHASKNLPAGWNGLAQQAFGTVVDGLGAIIEGGASLFSFNFAVAKQKDALKLGARFETAVPADDPNDYGFVVAERLFNYLHNFALLLGDGCSQQAPYFGMDWKTLSGYGDKMKSAGVLKGILNDQLSDPRLSGTHTKIRNTVESILVQTLQIAKQIDACRVQESSYEKAGVAGLNEGTIRSWQSAIRDYLNTTAALVERRNVARRENRAAIESSKKKSSISSASRISMLQVARDNYSSSQNALLEAQKRLSERTERERRAKEQFNNIQAELQKLGSENLTMTEVKKILSKCMNNLQQFQEHLSQLVTFFSELHGFVERTYELRAKDFIEEATMSQKLIDETPQDQRAARKQKQMEDLLVDSLKLKGYYSVLREIAGTYVEVSRKHIMPGVNQVDRLSLTDDGPVSEERIAAKTKQIADFADKAQRRINELANKRKKGLQDQLMAKRGEAEEVGYMIKAAEEAASNMTDGSSVSGSAHSAQGSNVEDLWAV